MIRIEASGCAAIYRLYRSNDRFFPLIAAVLLNEQDGVVYVDDPASPTQAYVEHAFGFAQVFGETVERFEQQLERYLLVDRRFKPGKIRLYGAYLPRFLALPQHEPLRSRRQRFTIDAEGFSRGQRSGRALDAGVHPCGVAADNVGLIDDRFGVVRRFWRNAADFVQRSKAVVVSCNGEPASICYAAAEADHCVEIDVLTLPEYRNRGLAWLAVSHFVRRCFSESVRPLWDCFTNNAGSVRLCTSIGFAAAQPSYPFFTIDR